MRLYRPSVVAVCFSACLGAGDALHGQTPKARRAATAAQAAKVLDLTKTPLAEGSADPGRRTLAGLSYEAAGPVAAVFEFHRKALADTGFKELPGGYASADAASGTFDRDGYKVSLSVFTGTGPDRVSVTLTQHGNVDPAKLPVPGGAKPFFSGPASSMFLTEASPDDARDACRKLLLAQGWEAYGEAGDALFLRQNAVRLTANVTAAPAQGGKTMIMYSTELLSVELPAPPETTRVQYSDDPPQLSFDAAGSKSDVDAFYRKALADAGWKATTEKPLKIDHQEVVIFRNPAKEMLTLEMHDFEEQTRGLLKFDSAAEVARQDRLADAKMKERSKDSKEASEDDAPAKLALAIPAGATGVKIKPNRIEFRVANGKAKAAVEQLTKALKEQSWEGDAGGLEDLAGAVSLSKEKGSLTLHYTDTGFLPAEVTIDATGVELERAEANE